MEEAGEKVEAGAGGGEETGLLEGVAVLDFDMLCATVALQTQGGYSLSKLAAANPDDGDADADGEFVGVQRMWEGDVCDCFDDRRIALQTLCCPCYQFGKNMGRAGTGSCFLQGVIYLLLALFAVCSYLSFIFTKQHVFLYLGVAFTLILLTYLGFCRTQIRKQFNIRVTDSSLDDCIHHLTCSCCALCQEARTLEINNVQDGYWRGRGDTICVGSKAFAELHQPSLTTIMQTPELCSMEKPSFTERHSWNVNISQSNPLVPSKCPVSGS